MDKVFMISDRALLGPELIADVPCPSFEDSFRIPYYLISLFLQMKEIGHSRIPVYHNTRDMIIGILLVFDILSLNPNDRVP